MFSKSEHILYLALLQTSNTIPLMCRLKIVKLLKYQGCSNKSQHQHDLDLVASAC